MHGILAPYGTQGGAYAFASARESASEDVGLPVYVEASTRMESAFTRLVQLAPENLQSNGTQLHRLGL
jgi:hypothetical protein